MKYQTIVTIQAGTGSETEMAPDGAELYVNFVKLLKSSLNSLEPGE